MGIGFPIPSVEVTWRFHKGRCNLFARYQWR